jgi:23S rRNA (guanosine2251-2'-O)-methyltransferase
MCGQLLLKDNKFARVSSNMETKHKNAIYLYGKNPLKEALLSAKRTGTMHIEEVFLTKSAEADPAIMSLLQSNKVTYSVVTYSEIESHVGRDTVHQGVLARLSQAQLYTSFDEMLQSLSAKERPLLVLLDELQDPHNVGAIIRSAVAFGADAILLPEHNQTQITASVIKSSSGMNFSIPIVRIGNINTTLITLQGKGFWVYGLTGDGDALLPTTTFDSPSVIVVGSEGDGIAKKTLEHCDFKLSVPISKQCESLNASTAVAVTLYEWRRQQSVL